MEAAGDASPEDVAEVGVKPKQFEATDPADPRDTCGGPRVLWSLVTCPTLCPVILCPWRLASILRSVNINTKGRV